MRRFSLAFMATTLGAVVFASLVIGCGGKKDDDDDGPAPPKKKRGGGTAAAAETLKPVQGKYEGTITGKVTFEGDPASVEELTAALQKEISAKPDDHSYCMKGRLPSDPADFKSSIQPYETVEQEYRIGKNKGLGNVFVWIEPEAGYHFEVPPDQLSAIDKEVVLTQPHCSFLPHCAVVFPSYYKGGDQVKTGQSLFVENDARVSHNAKVSGGPLNGESNQTLEPKKGNAEPKRVAIIFKPEKREITVSCDIHKWMKAYVRAFDHPYATVTSVGGDPKKKVWENLDSDVVGTYAIKGVPVGAKVKLFVWHEKAGFLNQGGASGEAITLGKDNKKDFAASKK